MHPFRFSVQVNRAESMKAWRDLARRVEAIGYSSLYIPDHLNDQFGPLVALTVAAEATTTLKVGSLVFDNDYRHPVLLAKETATLDLACDGRLEVGLGAGWLRTDYDASGIPYDDPAVRVRRFEEAVSIVKALWRDGRCTFEGEFYELTDAVGEPRPVSRPHPPLIIGGGSRKVLGIAGREAQIVSINASLRSGAMDAATIASTRPEAWDQRIEWVRAGAGDRFDDLEIQVLCFLCSVTDDRSAFAEQYAPFVGVEPSAFLTIPMVLAGSIDEIGEELVRRRERWGLSHYVFHESEIESFAPVVEALTGR